MRLTFTLRNSFLVVITLVFFSCSGKKEEFVTEPLSDFMVLQPGKYITYRLDSLVFTNFGKNTEIHKYQMKHEIDAELVDNLGRPSWRVYTYLRDSAGTELWTPIGSYFITPLAQRIEVTDDNLRVTKLQLPITEGFQWKGNTYLPDEPYAEAYDFNNDNDMKTWNFTYDAFEPISTYQGHNYTDVRTIIQQDDSFNVPVVDVSTYGYKTLAIEKYAKNIGMVYRKYEMWEYQPNISGANPYNTGFGVTLWMIDHN
jgi:hypothetical protein